MKNRIHNNIAGRILALCAGFVISSAALSAQNTNITGKVIDSRGEPVIGAAVMLGDDTSTGVVADLDGRFSIPVTEEDNRLTATMIGYETVTVDAKSGQDIVIRMNDAMYQLEATVFTAKIVSV